MPETIEIPPGLNGPPASGQGGYVAGIVAQAAGEPAEVTLRSPAPMAKALTLERTDRDAHLRDGETVVAEGRAIEELGGEPPEPVTLDEAERARSRYAGSVDSPFANCFVCGPAREDSQGVFAGPVDDRTRVATPWTPSDDWLGNDGEVRPPFVWAALDCPTWFAVHIDSSPTLSMLARLSVVREAPVRMGDPHVIVAWPVSIEGRKRRAGAALFTSEGELRARADALMIEVSEIPAEARG